MRIKYVILGSFFRFTTLYHTMVKLKSDDQRAYTRKDIEVLC